MKKLFTAIALASIIATPAFATTIHHRAAPSSRHLYMYAPEVAPRLQSQSDSVGAAAEVLRTKLDGF